MFNSNISSIQGGSLNTEKLLKHFVNKHQLTAKELIECSRLYSILAQMASMTISCVASRLDCFHQAVRLVQAAAQDYLNDDPGQDHPNSPGDRSSRYTVGGEEGPKRGNSLYNTTKKKKHLSLSSKGFDMNDETAVRKSNDQGPIKSSALSVHAAQLGTYLMCQLRKLKEAIPHFQLSESSLYPGMDINARSRVWVRIAAYYLESFNILSAENALKNVIVSFHPNSQSSGAGAESGGIATGGIVVLLALIVARHQNAFGKFIEQQIELEDMTGEIGGSPIGFRSTMFAASEAGYLDFCHQGKFLNN